MVIVGGNLEKKEIGLPIDISGTHDNTVIDKKTGLLRLKEIDTDGEGNPIYAKKGTWTSDVINLKDKFKDFEKVFTTHEKDGSSSFGVLTRVSKNGDDWSDWIAIAMDGTIQSDTQQYIQVKIELFAGFTTGLYIVSNFDSALDVHLFNSKEFIETSNGLRLKRDYSYGMTIDSTWSDEGYLLRKKITRDEWLRIDRLIIN